MIQFEAVDHVAVLVHDLARAIQWYHDVLGMDRRYQDVWTGRRDPVVMATGPSRSRSFFPQAKPTCQRMISMNTSPCGWTTPTSS